MEVYKEKHKLRAWSLGQPQIRIFGPKPEPEITHLAWKARNKFMGLNMNLCGKAWPGPDFSHL